MNSHRFLTWLVVMCLLFPTMSVRAQESPMAPAEVQASIVVNSSGDEDDADLWDGGRCDITGKNGQDDSYSGICTLRAAIETANITGGVITFARTMIIQLTHVLPEIAGHVTIDGGNQVILDGSQMPSNYGLALYDNDGSSTIQGMTIQGFVWGVFLGAASGGNTVQNNRIQENGVGVYIGQTSSSNTIHANTIISNINHGVQLLGSGNVLTANRIGTDGAQDLGNGKHGVYVYDANANQIGGTTGISPGGACTGACNLISGNGYRGVYIEQITDQDKGKANVVQGNFIGTDQSGTAAIANGHGGIMTSGDENFFRGNLISGNAGTGLLLWDGATANMVTGNLIGSEIDGATPLGNQGAGIGIGDSAQNVVGGALSPTCQQDCNVIIGNETGIDIFNNDPSGTNQISGNFIGVTADGSAAPGNQGNGISAQGISVTVTSNVIAGNLGHGVEVIGVTLGGTTSKFHRIQGNYIGVGPDGVTAMGNRGHGVLINHSSDNWIGGTTAGEGNIIGYNGADGQHDGVVVTSDFVYEATNNRILHNSIYANGGDAGIGIDLGDDGPSPNDEWWDGDADGVANRLQHSPVITRTSGALVEGELRSARSTTFHLEFFGSPTCSDAGYGQGKNYLGSLEVTTNYNGLGIFRGTLTTPPGAQRLTATATDPEGNTSEFSACYSALVVNSTGDRGDLTLDAFCNTGQLTANGDPECTLRTALEEANATATQDTITFAIPGVGDARIAVQSRLPDVAHPVIIDATSQSTGQVVLDGANAGAQTDGLRFLVEGSQVQGMTVSGFNGNGLVFQADEVGRATIVNRLSQRVATNLIVENNAGAGIVTQVDIELTDVTVRNNDGDGIGVIISGWSDDASAGLTLSGASNQIVDNGGHGINTAPGHVRIQGGTQISGNTGWGILANGRVTIGDGAMQTIHDNDGGGINVNEGLSLPPDFTVENNGGPGLVSVNQDIFLERITVRGNGGDGIGLVSGDLILREAEISANQGYGIWARNGDSLRLTDATVQGNGLSGISADGMSLDARWLFLDQNDGSGLVITGPRATIQNGRISRNGEYGILAVDTALTLLSSSVWGNGVAGVQVVSGGGRSDDVAQAAGSRSTVTGSEIRNNGGTGIFYNAGPAGLSVAQSHLQEDGGYALVNGDPAVTVMAQGNWWGGVPDPAGAISGTVDYTAWHNDPFQVVVTPAEEQFMLSTGKGITNVVGLRNFAAPGDTLAVVVTDTLGWLTGPTHFTVTLDADMGGSSTVVVVAPADTLPGATNRVRVTAISQQTPSAQSWADFWVMALGGERLYLPVVVR